MMDVGVAGETRAAEREGVEAAAQPLELERLAELNAELDLGEPRDALLAREGLSASRFAEAQELWLARMAREATRGRFKLSTRYSNAFVAHHRALADGSARPTAYEGLRPYGGTAAANEGLRPYGGTAAANEGLRPYGGTAAANEGLRPYAPMGLPPLDAAGASHSAASAPATAAASASASASAPATAAAAAAATASASAFAPATVPAAVPVPVPALAPAFVSALESEDEDEEFQGTMVGEISPFARKPELPFQRGAAAVMASPEPKASAPLPFRPAHEKASKSETIAMPAMPDLGSAMSGARLSPLALSSSALPFRPAAPETVDLPLEEEDEEDVGNATVVGTIDNLRKLAELPFKNTPSAAARESSAGSGLGGLPFRAAAEADATPRLTLEQFASLAAEIAVNPVRLSEIRARYGFDEGSHRREAALHSRRFSADPALYQRFTGLFESYRDWLSRSGR